MKISTILIFCTTFLLYNCSPYYYAPNKANVPNIREQNDIRLDAGLGGGLVMHGADIQFAYAPLPHFGIMVNSAFTESIQKRYVDNIKRDETRSNYLEAGLGYFTKLKENNNWVFEIYGGGGKGNYRLWYDVDERARVDMNKYFIQPSLSFTHPRRNIEFSIGSRFSGASHSLKYSTLIDTEYDYDYRNLRTNIKGPLSMYWEPSFRFSGGFKKLKGYVSYTPSLGIFNTNDDGREFVNISLGVRLTLHAFRKKQ
jgi:hypothetical protein